MNYNYHLIFNICCSKTKILPHSLEIQPPIRKKNGYRIAKRACRQFLQKRLCPSQYRKTILQNKTGKLRTMCKYRLDGEDFENMVSRCEKCTDKIFTMTTDRHIAKFIRLLEAQTTWN